MTAILGNVAETERLQIWLGGHRQREPDAGKARK